jgi:hypothetical protein
MEKGKGKMVRGWRDVHGEGEGEGREGKGEREALR